MTASTDIAPNRGPTLDALNRAKRGAKVLANDAYFTRGNANIASARFACFALAEALSNSPDDTLTLYSTATRTLEREFSKLKASGALDSSARAA